MSVETIQPRSSYTFTTTPRALSGKTSKPKFRDSTNEPQATSSPTKPMLNIMTDPRIRRGSTVPAPSSASQQKEEEEKQKKIAKSQRLRMSRQKLQMEQQEQDRPPTPDAVSGRKHILHYSGKVYICKSGNSNGAILRRNYR